MCYENANIGILYLYYVYIVLLVNDSNYNKIRSHCKNYICCVCGPQCLYNLSTCILGDITYWTFTCDYNLYINWTVSPFYVNLSGVTNVSHVCVCIFCVYVNNSINVYNQLMYCMWHCMFVLIMCVVFFVVFFI